MRRYFVIGVFLLFLGCIAILIFGWEKFSFQWIQLPYPTEAYGGKMDISFFTDFFASQGLSPKPLEEMPPTPRSDIAIRSGTDSFDRKLIGTYSGTLSDHFMIHAWLFDDYARKEFIVVITGPGKLSTWQAHFFRPKWRQLAAEMRRALMKYRISLSSQST